MTEKIKSAIDFLTRYKGCRYEINPNECCHRECSECEYNFDVRTAQKDIETAINSLNAWEEVLNELEEEREFFTSIMGEYGRGSVFANSKAIDIINQKLAEIEE